MRLPLNCEVEYYDQFLNEKESKDLFYELKDVLEIIDFKPQTEEGKLFEVDFDKMMFADQNLIDENRFPEELWGVTKVWSNGLNSLKEKIQKFTNDCFQVCVAIYYPDGNSGVDFHSDYVAFGDTSIIPSISLGQERAFKFREKETGTEFTQNLSNGSLIVMGKNCQELYEHSLPIDPVYKKPRINLTFRKFGFDV